MINLKNLTLEEMKEFFLGIGEKPFRATQVYQWIYRGITKMEDMTDLSKDLREKLNKEAKLESLKVLQVQKSEKDGTRKYLFGLPDGQAIESVFMEYKYGNSLCISSQAGCRMGCKFCASTVGGFVRNLTAGEMADQLISVERDTGKRISHVVIMGVGEPLDNYKEVSRFLRMVNCETGLNLGMRNITLSTCGVIPVIKEFSKDFPQVNLAISLHSPTDEVREKMMPINGKYPLDELLIACKAYTKDTGRRVTFEYALVKDVNDTKDQISILAKRLRGILCHVNLIPLNEVTETGMEGSNRKKAEEIAAYLEKKGIPATVRREMGRDIAAACGQLRMREENQGNVGKETY